MQRARLLLTATAALVLCAPGSDAQTDRAARHVWIDANGDSLPDLYRLGRDAQDALLLNQGDGTFRDATLESGVSGRTSSIALPADIDGDGDFDLFLAREGGGVELLVSGTGVFTASPDFAELDLGTVTRAEWVDYDGDGRLDLSIETLERDPVLLHGEDGTAFTRVFFGAGHAPASGRNVTMREDLTEVETVAAESDSDAARTTSSRSAVKTSGLAGGTKGGSGTGGGTDALVGKPLVAGALRDQSNPTNWIGASSNPTIGSLYPLGIDLSIDAGGFVGMGTLNPQERLDVNGNVRGKGFVSTVAAGPPLTVASNTKVTNLNADLLDGFSASSFSTFGASVDAGEISAGAVHSSHVLDGTLADSDIHPNAGIQGTKISSHFGNNEVTTYGAIGVGTTTPDEALEVAGGQGLFSGGSNSLPAVEANGSNGPTNAYLGVQGTTDFDGVTTADWVGLEIGMAGISTGGSNSDNIGVLGHSNDAGVRGEYSGNPTVDWAELGSSGRGLRANGSGAGIEVTSPNLAAILSAPGGAVFASATNASVNTVWALASGTTSTAVCGQNSATNGIGVYGKALSTIGANRGVYGETTSVDGVGVYGEAVGFGSDAVVGRGPNAVGGLGASALGFGGISVEYGVRGDALGGVSYGVYSDGNFAATGTKNFIQPHPTDPTREIHFTALEGNEAGTYFRTSGQLSGGFAVVEVPEEFRLVTEAQDLTAHLTAIGGRAVLWVEALDLDQILVAGDADVEFHMQVHGIRRGFRERDTYRMNSSFVPEQRGVPFGAQFPDDLRNVLVENGTLNGDFTPNEATAERLGWSLRDRDSADAARAQPELERAALEASKNIATEWGTPDRE